MTKSVLDNLLEIIRSIKEDYSLPTHFKNANPDLILKEGVSEDGELIEVNSGNIVVYTGGTDGEKLKHAIFDKSQSLMLKGDRAVEAEFASLINSAAPYSELEETDNQLLKELMRIVPSSDINIINAALFIRRLYKSKQSVTKYKQMINRQYGSRGTNISNLVSADYYEDYVLPTYRQLLIDEGDDANDIFGDIYEEAVTQYPFAVFVAAHKGQNEIKDEVTSKIQLNILNNRHSLNIHGIGKRNQKTILSILEDPDVVRSFISEPDIVNFSETLFARIYF